jgi:hypothetical protein
MYLKSFFRISIIYVVIYAVALFFNCSIVDPPSVEPGLAKLRITEIHYHPRGTDSLNDDEFEFIELFNAYESTVELKDVSFTSGIDYEFSDNAGIQSGAFFVLASNPDSFNVRYGFKPDGVYSGKLKNSGEKIVLEDVSTGVEICEVKYSDKDPWPIAADGYGFSLVPSSIDWSTDQGNAENWMKSSTIHGSPGTHDAAFTTDSVR